MNKMHVCRYDFFDDFYTFKWNIPSNAGSVSIIHDGMQGDKGCVQLVDNSTGGRTAINTFNPLFRDNNVRTPPDLEIEAIGKANVPNETEHSVIYESVRYTGDHNFSYPTDNVWRHIVIQFYWRNMPDKLALRIRTIYMMYKCAIEVRDRRLVADAYRQYIDLTNTVSIFTYFGHTGRVVVDLIAYRQIHLTNPPQHRPNAEVYAHIHNGKGKEVGINSVGGVM